MNNTEPQAPPSPLKLDTSLDSNNLDSKPGLGFDNQAPPKQDLIDACVHCGFCLTTCPSYRVLGKENDSPRGRIYLLDAINKGEASLSKASVDHFDSCLGCLACTTACPSGVQYDQLISATRAQVNRNHSRSWTETALRTLIFSTFPYPRRLRLLLAPLLLYQKLGIGTWIQKSGLLEHLSPNLAAMESLLPEVPPQAFQDTLPEIIPAQGNRRYRVGMILGCVQRLFFADVNEATARVLAANGCEVVIPKNQGCCAALPAHQGQEHQAQELARQMIDAFEGTDVDAVIINASGCGHTLKEYGDILENDDAYREKARAFASKVKDVQEFLAEVGLTADLAPLQEEPLSVVYQDACHMLHGQKISVQPRQLLRQIPGVQLREPLDAALCCGSAGVYNMLQPEVAEELGQMKVRNLLNTGASIIASPNPGCSLQIQKHLQQQKQAVPIFHPIELLDRSIQGIELEPV